MRFGWVGIQYYVASEEKSLVVSTMWRSRSPSEPSSGAQGRMMVFWIASLELASSSLGGISKNHTGTITQVHRSPSGSKTNTQALGTVVVSLQGGIILLQPLSLAHEPLNTSSKAWSLKPEVDVDALRKILPVGPDLELESKARKKQHMSSVAMRAMRSRV